jgi:hypothetical protein
MAYRLVPRPGADDLAPLEVATAACANCEQVHIHRGEAHDFLHRYGSIVAKWSESALETSETEWLAAAYEQGFMLDVYDGDASPGDFDTLHMVVLPELPLYVSFTNAKQEQRHMPTLRRLAAALGYVIERVARDHFLEAMMAASQVEEGSDLLSKTAY